MFNSGSGAIGVVEGLRGGGFNGAITVISSEGYRPIDRTKLSKALLTDLSKLAWRTPEFYKDANIELVDDEATAVDFGAKKVSTKSGKSYDYTKLVLATGGSPRWLPLEGLKGDLGNVFVLRTLPHAQSIMEAAGGEGGKKIVVIGSSFIGMEVGNCLAGKKHDVTIIGMESTPIEHVMGTKVGAIFQKLVEKNGVKFKMSASVEKATPSSSDKSKVGAVHLKDGTVLEADIVIEGVGVKPATDFLKGSGVEFNKDGSLSTDESFSVKGLQDVYAIGDIATYPYHGPGGNGSPIRIEHWDVAQNSGRSVANTINNPGISPKPFIPVFWSALGSQLRYCGNTVGGYDDVIIEGETNPDKLSWVAYYTQGNEVVAAASMMKDPYVIKIAELMRRKGMPTKKEIQDGVDVMGVSVPAEIKM
jgi:NADPH-dependent 2,4-dienoyl-CoA reductase/sulfur reductase-like enzyme